ncbi:small acid-soluble spore protein P [Bacillus sp. D-CC]
MGKNNREAKEKKGQPEPLSGSHKVKNRNHSRLFFPIVCDTSSFSLE